MKTKRTKVESKWGTCQCCGRIQKAPGELMTAHGYTVTYGFFMGICQGTGHKPFELSIDLIESFIAQADAYADTVKEEIEALKNPDNSQGYQTWVCVHIPRKPREKKSSEAWVRATLVQENDDVFLEYVNPIDGSAVRMSASKKTSLYLASIEEHQASLNFWRIFHLEPDLKRTEEYAQWQRNRIKNWEPRPLLDSKKGGK